MKAIAFNSIILDENFDCLNFKILMFYWDNVFCRSGFRRVI